MAALFPDRNLNTSRLSSSRDLAPPLLRLAQAQLSFGSGLLTHLTRHRQLLMRGPKRPPFPARDPKSVPTALSQPVPARTYSQTVIPVCPSSCKMPCFKAFDVVLCGLPGAWYYINGCLPLAFTSFLSHLLTHLLAHILAQLLTHLLTLFPSSSHLSLPRPPSFLKQDLLFSFPLQISTSAPARHEH